MAALTKNVGTLMGGLVNDESAEVRMAVVLNYQMGLDKLEPVLETMLQDGNKDVAREAFKRLTHYRETKKIFNQI